MNVPSKLEIITDLEAAYKETITWYENQPEERFNSDIVEGKWTMGGHLYHLIKSTKAVSKGMGMPKLLLRMSFGICNRNERNYTEQQKRYKVSLAKILSETGQSAQPSNAYVPEKGRVFDKAQLLRRFLNEKDDFIKVFNKQSDKQLGKYVLPHPLMGKMTFREMTYFTIFHTYHHLDILKEKYEV